MPLIFTAVGRVKENLRTPSRRAWLHQRAWPASELRMKSAIDGGTIQPASGSYTAGKPSRFVSGGCATGETKTGQSCHGLCWSSFRRVGCFFTARRGAPSSSACRCAVRSSPRPSFRGPPSARGFYVRLSFRRRALVRSTPRPARSGCSWNRDPLVYRSSEATSLPSPALQRIGAICA